MFVRHVRRSRFRDRLLPLARHFGICVVLALAGSGIGASSLRAAGPSQVGAWSDLMDWPIIPIHMVLTRDGRVMSFGSTAAGQQSGKFTYDVWDPNDGPGGYHLTLPNGTQTDIFCAAQVLLPDTGDIMIAGGDTWNGTKDLNLGNSKSTLYRTRTRTLANGQPMNRARWYASVTTLANGESYVQGGDKGTDHPEVRGRDGRFRLLDGADTSPYSYFYPRNWVAPDGRVFGFSDLRMYSIDPSGLGSVTDLGSMPGAFTKTSTEAMFAPGKILRVGGGPTTDSTNQASVIDINGAAPVIKPTDRLPQRLQWSTATILADGKVLVTGGSRVRNALTNVNYTPMIWSPSTGHWTNGAATTSGKARLYHSTALLLADGSVLVGGGGAPGPQTNLNAEIYYPPYLFDANGDRAARPKITSTPSSLKTKRDFKITVDNGTAIARVVLVKTGSVTHSVNMDQRFLELPFTRSRNTLAVTAPKSDALATPGYYLLFVIDARGVPSLGKVMPFYVPAS